MTDKPKRHWFQFSILTLLFVTALMAIACAIALKWPVHDQEILIAGGGVNASGTRMAEISVSHAIVRAPTLFESAIRAVIAWLAIIAAMLIVGLFRSHRRKALEP